MSGLATSKPFQFQSVPQGLAEREGGKTERGLCIKVLARQRETEGAALDLAPKGKFQKLGQSSSDSTKPSKG